MIEAYGLAVLLNFSQVSRLCCALTAHGSCARGFGANLEFSESSVFYHRVMDFFDLIDYISVGFYFSLICEVCLKEIRSEILEEGLGTDA